MLLAARLAYGEYERHGLREEAACDEFEHPGRRVIEPLEIVHGAEQWPFIGDRGDQAECRQRDEEAVGRLAGRQAQHGSERDLLRLGEDV